MDADTSSPSRSWLGRIAALVLGLILALALGEALLRVLGKPRFYMAHSSPPQFATLGLQDDVLMYVNKKSSLIRFVYDGDTRGYFGATCRVDHYTNATGFRGQAFAAKAPNELRIAFLGDSFTFGEGVRYSDTTCDVTRRLLEAPVAENGRTVSTLNFGVGGHNSTQSLFVLQEYALPQEPDLVVLGYVLNDAEAPILVWHEPSQSVRRVAIADEQVAASAPPTGGIHALHLAKLVWKTRSARSQTAGTIDAYHGLYADDAEWWTRNRTALARLVELCVERDIPCYVLGWPVLVQLDGSYPFRDIHAAVGRVVEDAGGTWVDLEPVFRGRTARDLWVHPTDHHPNEIAHRIAAEALIERLTADGVLER